MARARRFDEGKVLDRATDVFCRHGYDGSSIADLSQAMELSTPSIYAAYGSKRGLFDAVLKRHSHGEDENREWMLSAPTAREVVQRLLSRAADLPPGSKRAPACLLIQGGITAGPDNADIPQLLAKQRRVNELALRDRFDRAKIDGDLAPATDTGALASFVSTVLDGLAVRASSGATSGALRKVVSQALANWNIEVACVQKEPRKAGPGGRPRIFCTDDALGTAMRLFWEKGYSGTSLSDLTDAMGITRPSLYACFGNKEALFLQALDRYQAVNMAYVRDAMDAPTAFEVVTQMLDGAIAAQLDEAHPRGCLSVMNSMEGAEEARAIRAEVLRRIDAAHALFVTRLERAKSEGDLPADADSEGLSRLLASVMQGIATMGAAGASERSLRALASGIVDLWQRR